MTKALPALSIGVTVRDRMSGYEGTVIQKIIRFGGNVRYAIQPTPIKPKKGEVPVYADAMEMDEHLLVVTGMGDLTVVPAPFSAVQAGDEVEDLASGFKGIALDVCTFINGCVGHTVQAKLPKDSLDLAAAQQFIMSPRLKVLKTSAVVFAKPVIHEFKPTGGPSKKLNRPAF